MAEHTIFLAVPCYHSIVPQALDSLSAATSRHRWTRWKRGDSLLACCFNRLVTIALNSQSQHNWSLFAMHHSDIEAPSDWLDPLTEELEAHNADVLSVAVAIKDNRFLSSTAIMDLETRGVRRLTMKQIHKLPETFDGKAAGCKDGECLAVNTGLWVMRFAALKRWVDEGHCFTIRDRIYRDPDGKYRASALSEDWGASYDWHRMGLKVMATRAVPVVHWGQAGFNNQEGAEDSEGWETDKGDVY